MSTALPLSSESHNLQFSLLACSSESAHNAPPPTDSQTVCAPSVSTRAAAEIQAKPRTLRATNLVNNRLAEVRAQQGVSQRTMARRMGMELKAYQALEAPTADLSLSQLQILREALDVPMVDLLEDNQELSRPVAERAKMIKVMKTAVALRETPTNPRVQRMAETLCEQLVDVMPELAEVSGWPQFGSRRGKSALGKALLQPINMTDLGLPE